MKTKLSLEISKLKNENGKTEKSQNFPFSKIYKFFIIFFRFLKSMKFFIFLEFIYFYVFRRIHSQSHCHGVPKDFQPQNSSVILKKCSKTSL